MKKLLFIVATALASTLCLAQNGPMRRHFNQYIDFDKYEIVDSLPLERIHIISPFDYDQEDVISSGNGDYLIKLPHKDKMIIRKTKDNKKAIVVYNSYCFGRHKEFTIKDSNRRLILWYEDSTIYCGYIYDKMYKVCKYFESRL